MVPFENLVGVAMAAKGLMAEIQILRKKMSPLQSLQREQGKNRSCMCGHSLHYFLHWFLKMFWRT